MDDAAPGRHPVYRARADGHLRAEAVAVQNLAIEQISDGRKVDVRMRAYVNAFAQDELSGSHLVKGNCPGSPFAGVNSTCTGRKTMDFQHLNGALAYHYRAKRAYFGQYRDRFSIFACN